MIYARGIAIGLALYALAWGVYYGSAALAESDYLDAFFSVFWISYCLFVGVCVSKSLGRRA